MILIHWKVGGIPVNRGGGCRNNLLYLVAHRAFEHIGHSTDENLDSFARRLSTARNAESGLVEDVVDAFNRSIHGIYVAHVSVDHDNVALTLCARQVAHRATDKVIQHANLGGPSVQELIRNGAPYKARTARDQYFGPLDRIHTALSHSSFNPEPNDNQLCCELDLHELNPLPAFAAEVNRASSQFVHSGHLSRRLVGDLWQCRLGSSDRRQPRFLDLVQQRAIADVQ